MRQTPKRSGSLRPVNRRNGMTWVLRYRKTNEDGHRVENTMTVGLVKDFPTESDASKEVDRLGLRSQINKDVPTGRLTLKQLAEHYLEADFGVDAVREKSDTTRAVVKHYVR